MPHDTGKTFESARRTPRESEKEQRDATPAERTPPTQIPGGTPGILWPTEFPNVPEPEHDWLLDGVLPPGGLSLLAAAPKVGRSIFARCLAVAVARGLPFLGRKVAPGTALVVSLEDSDRITHRHLRAIGLADGDPLGIITPTALPLRRDERLDFLEAMISDSKAMLVVLDTLLRFAQIGNINDRAEVGNALDPLLRVARRTGACILATHPCRKSGGEDGAEVMGSTAFLAACDTLVSMMRDGQARFVHSVQREGVDLPPTLLAIDDRGWVSSAGTDAHDRMVDDKIIRAVYARPTMTTDDLLREMARFGPKAVHDSLRRITGKDVLP